jgi:hypothetical protein
MDDREVARIIIERMKVAVGVKSQAKLAQALGIQPPSVTDAHTKGKIPERWFKIMEENFSVSREELCRPVERVSARSQVDMPYSTGSMGIAITSNGGGPVTYNQSGGMGQGNTIEVSDRERDLILRMRKHASPAMWERIEADLMEQEKRYG